MGVTISRTVLKPPHNLKINPSYWGQWLEAEILATHSQVRKYSDGDMIVVVAPLYDATLDLK